MDFNKGDLVILVDDESPKERAKRLKKKRKNQGDHIRRKFALVDEIERISSGRPITKKHKFRSKNRKGGEEHTSDANKRKREKKPPRQMYFADPDWFPMQGGLRGEVESVELDEEFINNTLIPHDQHIRES